MLVSPFTFQVMKETLTKRDFRVLTYHAINASGEYESNSNGNPIPLSWLSFKNTSGIRIAAVFDQRFFKAWSRDFYYLFDKNWVDLYEENSESYRLLRMVLRPWYDYSGVYNGIMSFRSRTRTTSCPLLSMSGRSQTYSHFSPKSLRRFRPRWSVFYHDPSSGFELLQSLHGRVVPVTPSSAVRIFRKNVKG